MFGKKKKYPWNGTSQKIIEQAINIAITEINVGDKSSTHINNVLEKIAYDIANTIWNDAAVYFKIQEMKAENEREPSIWPSGFWNSKTTYTLPVAEIEKVVMNVLSKENVLDSIDQLCEKMDEIEARFSSAKDALEKIKND